MRVAVVGATGQVGKVMRSVLAERSFPLDDIRFFASARSAGSRLPWGDGEVEVEEAEGADYRGVDIALMSVGADASRQLSPRIAATGAVVIDNSSAWRMDPAVPLVVAEVNADALDHMGKGIVANPNCTTMVTMPVLAPLHREAGLRRLVISTYQAVSGAGLAGARELEEQLAKTVEAAPALTFDGAGVDFPPPSVFPGPVAYNVLAARRPVPRRRHGGDQRGAEAARREPQDPRHPRPGRVGHVCAGAGVHRPQHGRSTPSSNDPSRRNGPAPCWSWRPGVRCVDVPTPLAATGIDPVLVGRLRRDDTVAHGLVLFVSGDNLRKGAALNAVQIAEALLAREDRLNRLAWRRWRPGPPAPRYGGPG